MATTALTPAATGARSGLYEWLTTTDHKKIGILYLANSFVMFIIAGILALVVRAELAFPGLQLVKESVYNEAFTLLGNNGTTTSQAGTSAAQIVAPTSGFTLPAPARYYLAITSDDATSTFAAPATAPITGIMGGFGAMTETTGSFGLAGTGTPAVATSEFLFLCGISRSTAA